MFESQRQLVLTVLLDFHLNVINFLKVNIAWQARLIGKRRNLILNLVLQTLVHVWIENEKLCMRKSFKDPFDGIIN
jgi:hypothetical protein